MVVGHRQEAWDVIDGAVEQKGKHWTAFADILGVRFARTSVKSSWSLRRRCWAKLCDCIEKFRATAKIRAIEADKVSVTVIIDWLE